MCISPLSTFVFYQLIVRVFFVSWTGLSGVYDINDHYEHEQKRAVEYVSTMHKAMNGVENFAYYSPTHSVKQLCQDKLSRWESGMMIQWKSIEKTVMFVVYFEYKSCFLPECLRFFCFTGPATSLSRLNLPQSSLSSSPLCPSKRLSTCCPESTTLRSSQTSCRRTGATTIPSTAASS